MTLQIVTSPVSRASIPQRCSGTPSFDFLETNLGSLNLGAGTRQTVRRAKAGPVITTLRDGAPVVKMGSHRLGEPLSHQKLLNQLQDLAEDSVVVVFGLGSGQAARTVRAMCRVPVLVYEPSASVLRSILSNGPLGLGDIPIVTGLSELAWYWRKFKGRELNVRVVITPGYKKAFPAQLRDVVQEVPTLLKHTAISRATYNNRAQVWVQDILENLSQVLTSPPFLRLENAYPGVPAFIVGAGPSLDKNVHLLRSAVKKGIVFATSSGALAMAKHGIEPQVVVCIESIDTSRKLRQLPCLKRSIRAFSLSSAPAGLEVGEGPLLPLHEALPQYDGPLQRLTGVSGVLTSGSVSTTALSLARIVGCSPIVLVGQDLAYTDGETYAKGTGFESSSARVDEKAQKVRMSWNAEAQRTHGSEQGAFPEWETLRQVPRWGGGEPVSSTVAFSAVRDWFESLAQLLANTVDRPSLINSTQGGSSIDGYEERSLQSVLAELPDIQELSPCEIANKASSGWRGPTIRRTLAWLRQLQQQTRQVELSARRCRRVASYARRAMRTGDSRVVITAYARLEVAEHQLRQAVLECPLVDAWSHRAVDRAVGESPKEMGDAQASALHAMGRSVRVATAVERSAKSLSTKLNETYKAIEERNAKAS